MTIAPKTVGKLTANVAPNSHSTENATLESTTLTIAASPAAPATPLMVRGRIRRKPRNAAQPPNDVTIAMFSTL